MDPKLVGDDGAARTRDLNVVAGDGSVIPEVVRPIEGEADPAMMNDPMPRGGTEGVVDSCGSATPEANISSTTLSESGAVPPVVGMGSKAPIVPAMGVLAHATPSLEVPIIGGMEVIRASPEIAAGGATIRDAAAAGDAPTGDEVEGDIVT